MVGQVVVAVEVVEKVRFECLFKFVIRTRSCDDLIDQTWNCTLVSESFHHLYR